MPEVGVAILGPGLLGLALADRLAGSSALDLRLVAGRAGEVGLGDLARGIPVSEDGVEAILAEEGVAIVFDTTGAAAHAEHAERLEAAGKRVVDLTPTAPREAFVPTVDLGAADGHATLHLVSSAAQVAAPFVHAVDAVAAVDYVEVVSTIAAATAGLGTRSNIDQLTEGTALAVGSVCHAGEARALIFLGSGGPERTMNTTVFARLADPAADDVGGAVIATAARLAERIGGLRLSEWEREEAMVTLRIDVGGEGEKSAPHSLEPLIATALMTAEAIANQASKV